MMCFVRPAGRPHYQCEVPTVFLIYKFVCCLLSPRLCRTTPYRCRTRTRTSCHCPKRRSPRHRCCQRRGRHRLTRCQPNHTVRDAIYSPCASIIQHPCQVSVLSFCQVPLFCLSARCCLTVPVLSFCQVPPPAQPSTLAAPPAAAAPTSELDAPAATLQAHYLIFVEASDFRVSHI